MATCACGVELPGKRRKCDACKAGVRPEPEAPKTAVDQLQARGRSCGLRSAWSSTRRLGSWRSRRAGRRIGSTSWTR
jgi:hypothetical protein